MSRPSLAKIATARRIASGGVDYSPRVGALCPWCGKRARITNTQPWAETVRVRYHLCHAAGCVLASMRISIKSIEVDTVKDVEKQWRKQNG